MHLCSYRSYCIVCLLHIFFLSALGILYLLVYRTENYKRLKSTIDRQSKKCEEDDISVCLGVM